MAQQPLPDGVTRVRKDRGHVEYQHDQRGVRGYKELSIGTLVYEYEFDMSTFPKSRDFETEWVDGPVRFRFERDETGDRYRLWAYPSGRVEHHWCRGTHGSGGSTWDSVFVRDPETRYGFEEGDDRTTQVKMRVSLRESPFSVERTTPDDVRRAGTVAAAGSVFALTAKGSDHPNVEDDYVLSGDMMLSQAKSLLRDAVEKPLYELRNNEPKDVLTHYRNAPGIQKHREQAEKKLKEAKWRLGRGEKPRHIKLREREEERRQAMAEQEPPRQSPPETAVGKPDEKNNRCGGCGGRFHRDDLREQSVNENSGDLTGTEWACPDCGSTVGADVDYHGPVPVKTHNGTELH